jgi:hypothetical protein
MRNLKLLCLAAFVAVSAMIGAAARDTATAESAAVTNYKQAVTKRVEQWNARMTKLNDDLTKAKTALAFVRSNPTQIPTTDPQGAIKDLQDKIVGLQETMKFETNSLITDVGLMTVSPPDKSEAIPLPGFIRDLVKAKGIPLANNVSFTPNINWNFKSGTLGSASGTINITFRNP